MDQEWEEAKKQLKLLRTETMDTDHKLKVKHTKLKDTMVVGDVKAIAAVGKQINLLVPKTRRSGHSRWRTPSSCRSR